MRILFVGVGGIGGCLAVGVAAAGGEVEVIARGAHLAAIRERGLVLHRSYGADPAPQRVRAYTAEEYNGTPDVIFLCVKEYALEGILPLVKRAASQGAAVIPLLNGIGVGDRVASRLPGITVLDGCFYGSAYISAPGEITHSGPLLRVVFGEREGCKNQARLEQLREILEGAGIKAVLSDQIRRDTFRKFMLVSPMAAVGAYYEVAMGAVQQPGTEREAFCALVNELGLLAERLGYELPPDVVEDGLKRLDAMEPEATASLQKDLAKGGPNELDGQIFEPVRLARQLGLSLPRYEQIAARFGFVG